MTMLRELAFVAFVLVASASANWLAAKVGKNFFDLKINEIHDIQNYKCHFYFRAHIKAKLLFWPRRRSDTLPMI